MGEIGHEPFFNPYLPEINFEPQEALFRKLYNSGTKFYFLTLENIMGRRLRFIRPICRFGI